MGYAVSAIDCAAALPHVLTIVGAIVMNVVATIALTFVGAMAFAWDDGPLSFADHGPRTR